MSDTQNSPHIQNPPSFENDEITLKELIEKLLEFWNELWHKKWWIVLIALPVAAFFGYNARKAEILYPASLTYLLNDGGGGGGAMSIFLSVGISCSARPIPITSSSILKAMFTSPCFSTSRPPLPIVL